MSPIISGGGAGGSLTTRNGAQVALTATQSINSGSNTAVSWATATFDSGSYTNIAGQPTRLTCAVTGLYLVTWVAEFAANATGARIAYIQVNGAGAFYGSSGGSNNGAGSTTQCGGAMMFQRTAADYVQLIVAQTSGGALNITTNSVMSITYLGS